MIGIEFVVVVEIGDQMSAGVIDRRVAGGRLAAVDRMPEHPDPMVGGGPFLQPGGRIIGRSVVNGQQFPVGESLPDNGIDRPAEQPGSVVDRHDDGNSGA